MSTPKKTVTSVETVERHVAFGFKASLVRTLANLCWKNQENKRQVRFIFLSFTLYPTKWDSRRK